MGAAATFEARTSSPEHAVGHFARALSRVSKPQGALVFCCGSIAARMEELTEGLHHLAPNLTIVVLSGAGVLSERGEIDEATAATGIIWGGGGPCCLRWVERGAELSETALASLLEHENDQQPTRHAPTLLFIRSERFDPQPLWELRRRFNSRQIFGAGTLGDPGITCCDATGVHHVAAVSLRLLGLPDPNIQTSHSCHLLSKPLPITKSDGAMVLEVDGEPALELLDRLGSGLSGHPLVFTLLASPGPADDHSPELLVRGIQGVDPDRRGLLISEEVRDGLHLTFGVRQASAARADIGTTCRRAALEIAGAAPRFGIYFNCSGRGRSLHGTSNVDTLAVKERFGGMPFAGFQSAFEIGPFAAGPALQLYTGVLAIFSAPS